MSLAKQANDTFQARADSLRARDESLIPSEMNADEYTDLAMSDDKALFGDPDRGENIGGVGGVTPPPPPQSKK